METMKNFDFSKFTDPTKVWYEISSNTTEVSATPGLRNYGKSCQNKIVAFSRTQSTTEISNTTVTTFTSACYLDKKKVGTVQGKIVIDDPLVPSRMSINFEGLLNKKAKYWVYDTDYETYAIVGNNSGKYWILSRDPKICPNEHYTYLNKLQNIGFDVSKEKVNLNVLKNCAEQPTKAVESK